MLALSNMLMDRTTWFRQARSKHANAKVERKSVGWGGWVPGVWSQRGQGGRKAVANSRQWPRLGPAARVGYLYLRNVNIQRHRPWEERPTRLRALSWLKEGREAATDR
jgi:hypothetical protein